METLLDQVLEVHAPINITQPGRPSVALIPAAELDALKTAVHLLRSRTNAERRLIALERTQARGTGDTGCRQTDSQPRTVQ